eukprot:2349805-Amphidinium_carterae.1
MHTLGERLVDHVRHVLLACRPSIRRKQNSCDRNVRIASEAMSQQQCRTDASSRVPCDAHHPDGHHWGEIERRAATPLGGDGELALLAALSGFADAGVFKISK